jgi:hypothetical protein
MSSVEYSVGRRRDCVDRTRIVVIRKADTKHIMSTGNM